MRLAPLVLVTLLVSYLGGCCFGGPWPDGMVHRYSRSADGRTELSGVAYPPQGEYIRGDGVPRTEQRALDAFDHIDCSGDIDLVVSIGDGAAAAEVTADSNLVEHIETRVEGNRLRVQMREGSYVVSTRPTVRVTAPVLLAIESQGGGRVAVTGVRGEAFSAHAMGSGDVSLSGLAEHLDLELMGSGDIDARGLAARDVRLEALGSGEIQVHVSRALTGRMTGSGDLVVIGEPTVRAVEMLGSGRIR